MSRMEKYHSKFPPSHSEVLSILFVNEQTNEFILERFPSSHIEVLSIQLNELHIFMKSIVFPSSHIEVLSILR